MKSVSTMLGVLCVVIASVEMMHRSLVDSLETLLVHINNITNVFCERSSLCFPLSLTYYHPYHSEDFKPIDKFNLALSLFVGYYFCTHVHCLEYVATC